MKFTYKGFAYHEDSMRDDCCEERVGWVLVPFKTELVTYHCDNCETDHIEIDYSRPEFKSRRKNEAIRYPDDQLMRMIQETLGHEVQNGEYIDATFDVDVVTPDTILLGDNNERRD